MTHITVACSFRYEPDWLVEQWYENTSWADNHVALNTRDDPRPWIPRPERMPMLLDFVIQSGAGWTVFLDPDERLEDGAGDIIREALSDGPLDAYRLPLFELWAPSGYRADGNWGNRFRRRVLNMRHSPHWTARRHCPTIDARIYHLAHIEPENRIARRDKHKAVNYYDNKKIGFDYIAEKRGLVVKPIGDRTYSPAYKPYKVVNPFES